MTTIIVTADGEIAADGQSRNGHQRVLSRSQAKVHVRERVIYAISGITAITEALITWVTSHKADPEKVPKCQHEQGWSMLVITSDGPALYNSEAPYRDFVELPFALGSGGDYALGAVAAGADARRAIEIAALYDAGTGGEIQVLNIAEALGNPIREAAE